MPKASSHDNTRPHTKKKLEVYRLYLHSYLLVLSKSIFFSKIRINDAFAGAGADEAGVPGSALIAAETIKQIFEEGSEKAKGTEIELHANEIKPELYRVLKERLQPYPFACSYNDDAPEFLTKWMRSRSRPERAHNFLFLDPYGYTQITNLGKVLAQPFCDILMFVPIEHAYRFLGRKLKDAKKKELSDAELNGVVAFLGQLNITQEDAEQIQSEQEFAERVRVALSETSKKEFSYALPLKKMGGHYIFFLSGHVLGAKLFLQALHHPSVESQEEFELISIDEEARILREILRRGRMTCHQFYEETLKKGIYKSTPALKFLQREEEIEVCDAEGAELRKGVFYANYKPWREKKGIRTYISLTEKGHKALEEN